MQRLGRKYTRGVASGAMAIGLACFITSLTLWAFPETVEFVSACWFVITFISSIVYGLSK